MKSKNLAWGFTLQKLLLVMTIVDRHPREHGDYDLPSYGKDGRPGGSGDAEDIDNRD